MGTESRKLAAILFADMVGFSALRQTLALELRATMMALAADMFPRHRGRLVNTMGDGFLPRSQFIEYSLGKSDLWSWVRFPLHVLRVTPRQQAQRANSDTFASMVKIY